MGLYHRGAKQLRQSLNYRCHNPADKWLSQNYGSDVFHIALYEPEIPPNTGNIIRLCANSGSTLHLIHPLGFNLDDKRLRRAGLDYHEYASINQYADFSEMLDHYPQQRLYACSTKGHRNYADIEFQQDDILLFGPETRGLPDDVLQHSRVSEVIRIPMAADSRSLNLSNSVAIILYEAWRQQKFGIDSSTP